MATSAADAPLTVSTDGTAGPYVVVTSGNEKAGRVRSEPLLKVRQVRFGQMSILIPCKSGPALRMQFSGQVPSFHENVYP